MTQQANRRIAKNTIVLYGRLLFSMVISLYISRVTLNVLGVEDFGIYSVVAGFVIMFGFLNSAMAASTQRFLTFELGKGDVKSLKNIFNVSLTLHYIIALIVLILAETIGLWCLNSFLNISPDRMYAANWVYQFSIFTFIANIVSVPYTSAIIANEKMTFFAYVSIVETLLKLLIVVILVMAPFNDKLIWYTFLLLLVAVAVRIIDTVICRRNFPECQGNKLAMDKEVLSEMGKFAGWNLFGVAAGVGYNQGVNIVLNIFYGVSINAARGIGFQVQGAISNLVTSFQMASAPMITKYYSQEERQNAFSLVMRTSKFSFYLLLFVAIPLLIKSQAILVLWLNILPPYTVVFTQLIIIDVLINSLSGPLHTLIQATGNVKRYQLLVSGLLLLNLPTAYLFLKLGFSPESTVMISVFYSILALALRLVMLKNNLSFPVNNYVKTVLWKSFMVGCVSYLITFLINHFFSDGMWNVLWISIISFVLIIAATVTLGLDDSERSFLKAKWNAAKVYFK